MAVPPRGQRSRLGFRLSAVAALALATAGCVAYAPSPPHPETFPERFAGASLSPHEGPWTGADLLAEALARNPAVAEARARYQAAIAAARASRVLPAPSLTLTAEYANERPHWGYAGVADLPLDLGARRSTRINAAELAALRAFYDYGEAAWSVRMEVQRARLDILSAETEIGLADAAAQTRRDLLKRLEQQVAAGEAARPLALDAKATLAAAERRAVDAHGRLELARRAMAKALAVPPTAVESLNLAPLSPLADLPDLPAWRREAAVSRRDVLQAVVDYDLAENALRAEVARQYPEVRLGPGYNYDHGVTKLPFDVALALPPPDLNRAAISAAEASRAAAGKALEATQAKVLAEVDRTESALGVARTAAAQAGREAAAAQQAVDAQSRALAAGAANRVDELTAQALLAEARLGVADADRARSAAEADLEDAVRRPFDPGEAQALGQMLSMGSERR